MAPACSVSEESASNRSISRGAPDDRAPVLEVFVRDGCPHCADAKAFLAELARERPELRIVLRPVDTDAQARDELIAHYQRNGRWPPAVPTFVYAGRMLVGFSTPERSGPALRELIDAASSLDGGRSELEVEPRDAVATPFGTLRASRVGLPAFTLALGLLDGFNPCAMWVLLFLLSLLVRLRDRRRMALIAGTFVAASGAVYYAFMAAWLNLFLAVGLSTAVRIGLAITALVIAAVNLKDFLAPGHGPSLVIPASAKPGIYARVRALLRTDTMLASLVGVTALAVIVNFVELLCTAGLPAIYTAVLTQQQLAPSAYYGYLGLYIVGYLFDDALMVSLAVIALGQRKLTERAGRSLKLLSGIVMLVLGLVLLLAPEWLS